MTPERANYLKDYYSTPRGQEVRTRALKKFNASPKGRANRKAYHQSGKGKLASKRYSLSYRGVLRALLKRALERHKIRWPQDPTTLNHAEVIAMWRQQDGLCALSGIKMTWGQGAVKATSLSIDRIDSQRGYHRDNVRLICTAINAFRGNGTDEEMIAMAKAIIEFTVARQHRC